VAENIQTITRVEIIEVDKDYQSFQNQLNSRLQELSQQYKDQEFGILEIEVKVMPIKWTENAIIVGKRETRELEDVRYIGIVKYQYDESR